MAPSIVLLQIITSYLSVNDFMSSIRIFITISKQVKLSIYDQKNYLTALMIHLSQHGNVDQIKALIDRGAVPYACGNLSMMRATYKNNIPMIDLLIEHGADPCAYDSISLIYAVDNNNLELVKRFISYGANPRAWGDAPIYHATRNNYTEIFDYLRQIIYQ